MMTIKMYRASPGSPKTAPVGVPLRVPSGDPERLKEDTLVWPPCGCARCGGAR